MPEFIQLPSELLQMKNITLLIRSETVIIWQIIMD